MNNLKRLLSLVIPYKTSAALNVMFNFLTIFFSVFSIALIIPFLKLIFGMDKLVTEPGPLAFNKEAILQNLYFQISELIKNYGAEKVLMIISLIVLTSFFFKNLFRYLAMYSIAVMRTGIIMDLRNKIHNKILILPISYFTNQRKGDIISRATNDVQEVEWSIVGTLELMFQHTFTILIFLSVLFITSYQLTIFIFIVLPIAGYLISRIGKKLRRKSATAQTLTGRILSFIEESITGLRIIKGFNSIGTMDEKFKSLNGEFRHVAMSVMRKGDLSAPLSEFLAMVIVSMMLWYGGSIVLDPESSLDGETFIFYVLFFSQLIPSLKAIADGYNRFQKGSAASDRIFQLLDAEEKIVEVEKPIEKSTFSESIVYKNISFKYDSEPVLNEINLEIGKGKVFALVGASGAGKSTMVDLLPRFYDTTDGQILIDGIDVKELKINDLRSLMGIVTQEPILFNDTVANNIRFGSANNSMEAVVNAAKVANAHDFIMELPDGYETFIGDRGSKLSGGQRQRLTIARAVFKNPPILILDEATSSLDTESEKLVQEALQKLMENRTSIIIAHRLSTIQNADCIVVMEKGSIVEMGTHKDLVEKNGVYKKLSSMQSFQED